VIVGTTILPVFSTGCISACETTRFLMPGALYIESVLIEAEDTESGRLDTAIEKAGD
jgi:hypothetical protein